MSRAPGLLGRAEETSAVEAVVAAAAAQGSAALAVTGEAGMGKTALLLHAAATAPGAMTVLRTAGVEPEADLPFAALHRLLLPLLDSTGRLDGLPPSQAGALAAALGLSAGPGGPPDRFLVGAGVLSLLAEAAAGSGVLALVDDAQWLDRESAQALTFAARRLGAEGVGLLFAARDGGRPGFDPAGLPRLPLAGLAPADAAALLAAHGPDGLADDVRDRIVALSAGNPLALRELPAAMTRAQRAGLEPLPDHVPLGDQVRAAVLTRVAALPDATRLVLLLAAAEPAAELGVLATAAGALGVDLEALDAADRAGVVTVDAHGVRFSSALLRSAVYADAPFLRRRAVHAALAEAYGAGRPDRWAWHRAVIAEGADPVLADELERSADRARARAGYAATASMLERAAELSGDDQGRGRRLVAAAWAAWESGQPEHATQLLGRVDLLPVAGTTAARAAMLRGVLEVATGRPGLALPVLVRAARALVDDDPHEAGVALTAAMEAAAIAGDFTEAPGLAELADRLLGNAPVTGLLRGLALLAAGDPMRAEEPLRSFIGLVDASEDHRLLAWGAVAGSFLGDEVTALRFWDRAVRSARATGAMSVLPWLLENRALLEALTGGVGVAEADADESLRLAAELGLARPPLIAMVAMTAITALRGDVDLCRTWGTRTVTAAERHGSRLPVGLVLAVDLQLALSQGHLDEAVRLARQVEAGGTSQHPLVPLITFPNRVEALARSGLPLTPGELEGYEAWARIGERPYLLALLARCRALVAPPDEAEHWFEQALQAYEQMDQHFEQARTRLLHGEFLRRRRRPSQAREALRLAVDAFDRLGCRTWAERTRSELRATGESAGTPAAVEAFADLTPQELQIVRLVSGGLSNRQVAGQLFLSPRTVEYHLAKVYPKLRLASRAELIRVAATELAPVPAGTGP